MPYSRGHTDSHVTAYRPDVDGLRAIAVVSVILFHMSRDYLPGGYFGVDIFFVISGYLITSIVWRELDLGTFSIARFYDRRIRRIMPALLLVLLITAIVATAVLLPIDLIGFAKSLFATIAFVANVYFWRDADYFSRAAEEKPLLHIWSLGVEEQFYVLFPMLLLLLARYARGHAPTWISTLVVASFVLNVVAIQVGGASPAFYLLPTRAWQLGAGALVAVSTHAPNGRAAEALSLVGAAFIAFGLVTGGEALPAYLPPAVPATVGTALVIWSGARNVPLASQLLCRRWIVFVGLISYSLYLWHWPIIVFLKYYLVRDLHPLENVVAAVLMTACAVLSWRYVERPFRSSAMRIAPVRYAALAGATMVVVFGTAIIANSGFPSRLNPEATRLNSAVGMFYRCPVSDYLYFMQSRACRLQLPTGDPNDADVVLLGNSHAQMYAPVFQRILRDLALNGLLVPANACLPTFKVNISVECIELSDRNIEAVAKLPRARVVVIGTTWDTPVAPRGGTSSVRPVESVIAGLNNTIDLLRAAGKKVVLIGPLSTPEWDVASVASRSLAFSRKVERPLYGRQDEFEEEFATALAHFQARTDIQFVRSDSVQCSNGRCAYILDGQVLFADSTHLASAELERFRPNLEAALKRALAQE